MKLFLDECGLTPFLNQPVSFGQALEVTGISTVSDLISWLPIAEDIRPYIAVFVNGRPSVRNHMLKEQDRIMLFPPVDGG